MRPLLLLAALLLAVPAAAEGFDHADFDATLRQHVDGAGLVDYEALRNEPALERYVASLAELTPEEVNGWGRDEQVAFWINAYNALTLKLIVDEGIPKSIRRIVPDPWEQRRWTVAGRRLSLNWIEHTRLREQLKEPRVHFVLVCAAKSCPVLPNRAIVPTDLDAQLERAAKAFFQDATRNRVDRGSKTVHLSKILDWYGRDFIGLEGLPEVAGVKGLTNKEAAVVRYLSRYVRDADRAVLQEGGITVVYNEYDWDLNRR